MTTLKNKKGVSLVELIAVIVIMGIIATVGGISVATIIENSNKKARETAASDVLAAGKNYLQMDQTATWYVTLETLGNNVEKATAGKFADAKKVFVIETTDNNYYIITADAAPESQPASCPATSDVIVDTKTVTYDSAKGTFESK